MRRFPLSSVSVLRCAQTVGSSSAQTITFNRRLQFAASTTTQNCSKRILNKSDSDRCCRLFGCIESQFWAASFNLQQRRHKRKTAEEIEAASVQVKHYYKKKFTKPRPPPDTRETLNVWNKMTIDEFAQSACCSLDEIFELVIEIELEGLDSAESALSIEQLNRLCRLVNRKMVLHPAPIPVAASVIDEEDKDKSDEDVYPQPAPSASQCVPRPPVVTIMGHVDHGKTTLLDALRDSQIVDSEFGGITQHIGAFSVRLPHSGAVITFLDTPGHAAFKSMRARGARATDIVVLVVAADDGVMEQTLESIRFAREANVPILVAINKCDRYNIDIERTKNELAQNGLVPVEQGGDVTMVPISALKKTNLNELQEAIVDLAKDLELSGDSKGLVEGVVIESKLAPGIGKLCTVLVQRGTLKPGTVIVAGRAWCRVGKLTDEHGKTMKLASLSQFAEVTGWRESLPEPGSIVLQVPNEQRAKRVIRFRNQEAMVEKAQQEMSEIEAKRQAEREAYLARRRRVEITGYDEQAYNKDYKKPSEVVHTIDPSLPCVTVIVKADVEGSVEAIVDVLDTYDGDHQCALRLADFGVGPPTPRELEMAAEFNAIVYLFNVKHLPAEVTTMIDELNVEIRHFNVIYHLVDDLKHTISAKLPLIDTVEPLGEGAVLKEFVLDVKRKQWPVAGTKCERGTFDVEQNFSITRQGRVIYDGPCVSMRNEKTAVSTATTMDEIGLMFENREIRFEPGDKVTCYKSIAVEQETDWQPTGF